MKIIFSDRIGQNRPSKGLKKPTFMHKITAPFIKTQMNCVRATEWVVQNTNDLEAVRLQHQKILRAIHSIFFVLRHLLTCSLHLPKGSGRSRNQMNWTDIDAGAETKQMIWLVASMDKGNTNELRQDNRTSEKPTK